MKNLKIRVNNEAESKEIQELFFKLGFEWKYQNIGKGFLYADGGCISGGFNGESDLDYFENQSKECEEITLDQLRQMVHPMKEFLVKQNGVYVLVNAEKCPSGGVWVPDGANFYAQGGFFKNEQTFWHSNLNEWRSDSNQDLKYLVGEILWQRNQQPEPCNFIESTLVERGSRYGDFKDVATCTQDIIDSMQLCGYDRLPDVHKEALHMIASKISRILNGDPNYIENWHDIAGYAQLVENYLNEKA